MNRIASITPKFVEFIPKTIADGILYVSEEYGTASHNCACGCGTRVVTPLGGPTGWKIKKSAGAVSLSPSVGNWDYPCKSHYWIRNNRIEWAPAWTSEEIAAGRKSDRDQAEQFYGERTIPGGWMRRMWNMISKVWQSRKRQ